jgi:ribosomal protein S27AE
MKEIKVICPKCGNYITYKNWFSWIWHTPFHWFDKRLTRCPRCGERSYMKRVRKYKYSTEVIMHGGNRNFK